VATLRLTAVVALYLLRTVLAPSGTLRGLRQMVLDAAPVPRMIGVRRVCGEALPCPAHDHGIPDYGFERPSEDKCAAEVSAGTVCGEALPCAVHQGLPVFPPGVFFASHGGTIPHLTLNPDGQLEICNGCPGEAGDQDGDPRADQPVIEFPTKKAAFLSRYRGHPEYGNRSTAGRVAAELAPLAGLQAGTGRTYIAEELRKLTDMASASQRQAPAAKEITS